MNKGLFVAGTDTGIGKTFVTALLGRFFIEKKLSVTTQKWVQTGTAYSDSDVFFHRAAMGLCTDLDREYRDLVMPYSFSMPASPHLAAGTENKRILSGKIKRSYSALKELHDMVIVEGTGGLFVPLSNKTLAIDIVRDLDMPVLLVVGNRLGAINHTLLSVESLRSRGIKITGMVFNRFMPEKKEKEKILNDNRRVIAHFSGLEDLGEVLYNVDFAESYAAFRRGTGKNIFKAVYPDRERKNNAK